MEKTVMTKLKILTTAPALVMSLASAPVFAQSVRTAYASPNTTYDNSGWNGHNNGGYNNTWYDGREYRSDPMLFGEDIAADPTDRAPVRSHVNHYR
jgi:hypothetical protein